MRQLAAGALLLGLAACRGQGAEVMSVSDQRYSFPSHHISSLTRKPHTFVRLKPPEKQFSLVYDSRAVGAQSGPGVPRIFSVNDEGQTGVEYHNSGRLLVVCRKAVHPKGGCGTVIDHGKAQWAVLFPIDRIREAEAIVGEARAQLNAYRS